MCQDKSNIVLIMADQMTAFALSAYGNSVTKTPNLDALAAMGTVFDSQRARQMLHRSLGKGKVLDWEHYPNPMRDNSRQVRSGDEFPTVEQRGYLPYPQTF